MIGSNVGYGSAHNLPKLSPLHLTWLKPDDFSCYEIILDHKLTNIGMLQDSRGDEPAYDFVERVFGELVPKEFSIDVPGIMHLDGAEVALRLATEEPIDELVRVIETEAKKAGTSIKILNTIEAQLVSPGFYIKELTHRQQLFTNEVMEWKWHVKPKGEGCHVIRLILTVMAKIKKSSMPQRVIALELPLRRVKVFAGLIEMGQSVEAWLGPNGGIFDNLTVVEHVSDAGFPAGITPAGAIITRSIRTLPPNLSTIDEKLQQLEFGNIAFNAPRSMDLDDTALIHLILALATPVDDLKKMIEAEGEKEGANIRISDRMEARLSGASFSITAITPEQQAVSSEEITQWKWEVQPRAEGRHPLHLTLSVILDINNTSTPRAVRTFDKTINIDVSLSKRLALFLGGNWQWLWAAILVPLGGLLWKKRSVFRPT